VLIIANVLLWCLVAALAIAVLALARQVGVLYERVAPAGAIVGQKEPGIGDAAPEFELNSLSGGLIKVGGAQPAGRPTLLFFLAPTCPVCAALIPVLKTLREKASGLRVVLASSGELDDQRQFVREKGLGDFDYVLSTELGVRYQIAQLPFAVAIGSDGVISGKGLMQSRSQFEKFIEGLEIPAAPAPNPAG
jgi:methylamine dehydrogenase accessory protein MauD